MLFIDASTDGLSQKNGTFYDLIHQRNIDFSGGENFLFTKAWFSFRLRYSQYQNIYSPLTASTIILLSFQVCGSVQVSQLSYYFREGGGQAIVEACPSHDRLARGLR